MIFRFFPYNFKNNSDTMVDVDTYDVDNISTESLVVYDILRTVHA